MSDRSTIGLYFTNPPPSGRELQTVSLAATKAAGDATSPRTFSQGLETAERVVAIRPRLDRPYARVAIEAVLPTGRRVELLRPARPAAAMVSAVLAGRPR